MAKPKTIQEPDYVSFGPEWEKEMFKYSKKFLIAMLKNALKRLLENNISPM